MFFKRKTKYVEELERLKELINLAEKDLMGWYSKRESVQEELKIFYRRIGESHRQSDDLQKQILDMQHKLGKLNAEYMTLLEKKVALLEGQVKHEA